MITSPGSADSGCSALMTGVLSAMDPIRKCWFMASVIIDTVSCDL